MWRTTKRDSTGYCSSPPSTSSSLHGLPSTSSSLHGLLFIQPSTPRGPVQPPLHGHPSTVYFSSSPQHHGVLFIQRQRHRSPCTRETRIARPPTSHCNRELPEIFLPLASTIVFSVMDGPKNVMQLRLWPAQDEKPIFLSWFFVIEVGAHHIYDDTGFCHNFHHRSVICMTEIFFVRPKMSRICLFL